MEQITTELNIYKNPENAKYMNSYLKLDGISELSLGLTVPQIDSICKTIKTHDIDLIKNLIKSNIHEQKLIAVRLLKKYSLPDILPIINSEIGTSLNNWATVDSLCCKTLKFFVPEIIPILIKYSKSKNEWKRRISCVSLVNFSKKVTYNQVIIEICQNILNAKPTFRFTHLGVGWVLRDLSISEPERLKLFLEKNKDLMSSEGYRYATEKLNKSIR